ncbi:Mrp/NBP35 family ATP-binding protein [Moraxella sp. VT-16-12]|uniref:Mrp/NBP35 family ATP-binding protein n=1 Tax=Moraxella sp. VT-16-12 TaxID=2014877 RepID=UPI000B802642|nr:Mrp/NBP35 family ATP-binding protein [Moraxella sp. VT-16-12]TWV81606.1 Mrp/NBP35 family ATP-binding protein [Moraxella sp. VT-16-12]
MFSLFKKSKIDVKAVDEILANTKLFGKPITSFITDKSAHEDVLDVSLKIDNAADERELERSYHALQSQLQGVGVGELNFHVSKTAKVSSAKTFHPKETTPANSPQKTAPTQDDIAPHPRIRHTIVIASGKGGVGKSTTAVNVALALQSLGHKVGMLDADIYGPSVPDMLGVAGVKPIVEHEQFVPIDAHGLAILSIGSLLDTNSTPVAWRGIKATGALMQLYNQTNWPNLDYLIIDMPPGTGDIQLTLAQRIAVTGAVIVTTPQHIALLDVKKGVEMFAKTHIPIIGIIENMALHTCTNCGHTEAIFGTGGADEMTKNYGVPFLGRLPLASAIRESVDNGVPSVIQGDDFAHFYLDIAKNIEDKIGQYAKVRNDGRIF